MSGSVTVERPTLVINFSCYVHSEWANHFLLAISGIPQKRVSFTPVRYFLCCQALELGLKAFLSLNGVSNRDLKERFGHDLVRLLSDARANGLDTFIKVSGTDTKLVQQANNFYPSGKASRKRFQYIDVGWAGGGFQGIPDFDPLRAFTTRVVRNRKLKAMYRAA
jgi:hypothetical protein